MGFSIATEIFGKKVRRPADMTDDIEFEYYALEVVENRANDFIAQHELTPEDIKTYKIRMKKKEEFVKREIRGGKTINEKVQFMNVRIYLSYICRDSLEN